ncbi:MAG: ATP-dependent RecD-like DNA helicase [Anaerovorax sp.]
MVIEKQGTIVDIVFRNKENSYTIAIAENEEEAFTVVGYLPVADEGRRFLFKGTMKNHPNYGEQLNVEQAMEVMPKTNTDIEAFLASGVIKGIGKKTAIAIVGMFGKDTFQVIEETPEKLERVEGIGKKKALSIAESFHIHREFAEIALFFQQFDLNPALIARLYKVYGADTVEAVRKNPYQLVDDLFGMGFKKADEIAEKMGIPRDSGYRLESGIRFGIWKYVDQGHTYAPQKQLAEQLAEMLDVRVETICDVMVGMAFDGIIHIENLEGRPVVFLMPYFAAEQNVCKTLLALEESDLKPINGDLDGLIAAREKETGIYLSENQKFAVKKSLENGVTVITGGPGTGKTTIINTIMKILDYSGLVTAIAAPTGRAAKRIKETSGYEASTIHRLLEYYYSEGDDSMKFGKNRENPLDYDVVIIDESSMIDILLMNGLMSAILPGTRLIMVGDADQLPSVGAGNVLRDMIDSELIYSVKLTEIFRQAKESLIVVNAHRINRGSYPAFNEKDKDFFFLRRKGERDMLETIKELCIKRLPNYYQGCDVLRDVQVLTPVRKGMVGMLNLNTELQKILNPPSPQLAEKTFGTRIFRENDKVMQIKNNYQLEWKSNLDFTQGQGVFNGDVGYIHKVDLEFHQITVVYEDTKFVTYEFSQLDEVELAYAVTVHKSQGSEFPIVIMPVSWFPPVLATRNLLYTAVTRGKKLVILVGSEDKIKGMVDNHRIIDRYSGLNIRLKGFLHV